MLEAALYLAIAVFIQILLTVNVGRLRARHKVLVGDEGFPELRIAIRMHGNFVETVPIALLALIMYETVVIPPLWSVHALGGMLIGARILHAIGLMTTILPLRGLGMLGTLLAMLIPAVMILLHYFEMISF